jgi:peptidyl-tRNA hydrolase
MSPGKAAAQAGHAYKLLTRKLIKEYPLLEPVYFSDGMGTNITLTASFEQIKKIWNQLQHIDAPSVVVIDEGHIHLPHFDGSKITTAIGIGPVYKDDLPNSIKNLSLY